jgi:hypothetical protein
MGKRNWVEVFMIVLASFVMLTSVLQAKTPNCNLTQVVASSASSILLILIAILNKIKE